jgi:hypothetical protein
MTITAALATIISVAKFGKMYPDRFHDPQALIETNRWGSALYTSAALTAAMFSISVAAEIYQYKLVRREQLTGASVPAPSTTSPNDQPKPEAAP